mmetsp:Transcript_65933/g.157665  ORF Transcript_65933/g.157665 Transcript_65933/m.157665 type:complete len:223 (+) Transcript_65933:59-727(+)
MVELEVCIGASEDDELRRAHSEAVTPKSPSQSTDLLRMQIEQFLVQLPAQDQASVLQRLLQRAAKGQPLDGGAADHIDESCCFVARILDFESLNSSIPLLRRIESRLPLLDQQDGEQPSLINSFLTERSRSSQLSPSDGHSLKNTREEPLQGAIGSNSHGSILAAFRKADVTGGGKLKAHRFVSAIRVAIPALTDADVDTLMQSIAKDGSVHYEDFLRWVYG